MSEIKIGKVLGDDPEMYNSENDPTKEYENGFRDGHSCCAKHADNLQSQLTEANRKLEIALKALEFYACVQEEAHPQLQVNVDGIVSWESISGRAREALKEIAECDSPMK